MRKTFWSKILTVMLAFTVLVCPLTAQADMIWEPEDSFWETHREECEYLWRGYRAGTEVKIYQSPKNSKVVKTLAEGEQFRSAYTYIDDDGNAWALYEESGWLPKAGLEVLYDYISFEKEYGDVITESSGQLAKDYRGETVYFWNYPGSVQGERIEMKETETNLPEYHKIFTDESGRAWGFVGYWCGYRNFWICLDEPAFGAEALYDGNIPPRGVHTAGDDAVVEKLIESSSPGEEIVPDVSGRNQMIFLVTLFVAGVIIITAVILRKIKKESDRGKKQWETSKRV